MFWCKMLEQQLCLLSCSVCDRFPTFKPTHSYGVEDGVILGRNKVRTSHVIRGLGFFGKKENLVLLGLNQGCIPHASADQLVW